jgi:hypothetical protein
MTVKFSALDLLDLPPLEREVVLWVARNGPATPDTLADGTGHDPGDLCRVVDKLVQAGRLQVLADGRLDAALGRVARRTTLPITLWPALATDRPFTGQEIATLRAAIPILQFARARMGEFIDHGPGHAMRVRSFAVQLSYLMGLTASERHLLRVAALFHDVGNVVDRDRHHIISQETVEKLAAAGEIPFTTEEAGVIGLLCRWHRREYDPDRVDHLQGETIRTGLLASVLRVADAMDIDHRRSDYDDRFRKVLRFFYPEAMRYWTSIEEIAGVRIACGAAVHLQTFTWDSVTDNIQIDMLRRDLASTPLDWSVQQIALGGPRPATAAAGRVLLVFPFDAHSLVMAALSRRHLTETGAEVDLLCYPDTPDGPGWLWGEELAAIEPDAYERLVVIGDRPDPRATLRQFETIQRWQAAGATVTILNRFEANWFRVPGLVEIGTEVILGGDWAYFWGDPAGPTDLEWGRVAALCVRDPTLSTVGVTDRERAVTSGLQSSVLDVLAGPAPDDGAGWQAHAEPILDRIATDDRAFFIDRATGFAKIAAGAGAGRVNGRVVVYDRAPGEVAQSFPWILEAAIESHGRAPERGMRFNVPHAIAFWPEDGAVEILAITHWREEDAIPIRLLYPEDLGPQPQGNEHALRVRVPAHRATVLVDALVATCNEQGIARRG